MGERLRLMAVHAHPDDESSKGAATMASYVAEGVDVLVVTCTGGERGDVLNPALQDDPEILRNMPEVRRREMAKAPRDPRRPARVARLRRLRAARGRPAAAAAGGLLRAGADRARPPRPLVRLIREFRPHVMTTYDENGGYPHPDHIMCHTVSMAAFAAAGDPRRYPHAGEPWQPLKIYYNQTLQPGASSPSTRPCIGRGLESPYAEWLERWEDARRAAPSPPGWSARRTSPGATRRCSRTPPRSTPTAPGSTVPLEMQQRDLADRGLRGRAVLRAGHAREDDLFAGLGSPEEATELATSTGLQIAFDGTGDES